MKIKWIGLLMFLLLLPSCLGGGCVDDYDCDYDEYCGSDGYCYY